MNLMQKWLQQAANELGIDAKVEYCLRLPNGNSVVAQAYFPQLGMANGLLVFSSFEEIRGNQDEIKRLGYGISIFGEPLPKEQFDLGGYAEMFADWGWTAAAEDKPNWMKNSRLNLRADPESC